MAIPATYPLSIRIGDSETVTVSLQDDEANPINISGRVYSAQIRAKASSPTALVTFSCSIIDAAGGKFACNVASNVTAALSPANAVWDLQEDNNGVITTLLAGPVVIARDVTR
jgi:hypothetical protein